MGHDTTEHVAERNRTSAACFSSLSLGHFKDPSKVAQISTRLSPTVPSITFYSDCPALKLVGELFMPVQTV